MELNQVPLDLVMARALVLALALVMLLISSAVQE
jgi:hypothetical protein